MHLHHERSMIRVQCQLMFCRAHLCITIFSMVDDFMIKLMSMSNFALLSSFRLQFERVINRSGGQKSYQLSISIWSIRFQCVN